MKKHNCKKLINEARGCSVCSNLLKGLKGHELQKTIEQTNWIITEQKKEIEELKKKLEYRLRRQRIVADEACGLLDENMKLKEDIEQLKQNAKEWEDEARTLRDEVVYLKNKLKGVR